MAARRLRAEREQACDDQVLRTGASACDYAEHLLAVARRLRPAGRGTLGVAMACRSAFSERVAALLDAGRARGVLTMGLLIRFEVGTACLVVPLAALHPGTRSAADAEPPPAQVVGPPPSANAQAAGPARDESAARRAGRREGGPAPSPLRREHDRPSPAKVSRTSGSETVMVYSAPEIRAVIGRPGAFATPEAPSTTGERQRRPQRKGQPAPSPKLVWVPTAGATP